MVMPRDTTYEYMGYKYIGEVEDYGDNLKMWHYFYNDKGEEYSLDRAYGPYEIPTYDEFVQIVDLWRSYS